MEVSELCARYRRLYLPSICDALYELGETEHVLPTSLRPLFPESRIVGHAYTVEGRELAPVGWNAGIPRIRSYLEVFDRLEADSVLVSVTPGGRVGHFGELTANAAAARGCVGCILDGNLRDIEGLRDIGFPVFYRDLSPLNAIGRWEMVASEQPVTVGGVVINQGDIIVAEFDGIVVVPRDAAERVLLKSEEIVSAEKLVRAELSAGGSPYSSFERHGHI